MGVAAALTATVAAYADTTIYTDNLGRMHFLGRDAANNINKGKATVIVTGLGETSTEKTKYYGSKTKSFTIKKGDIAWY